MPMFADRFLVEPDHVVDLATGEVVRLRVWRHPSAALVRERTAECDQLANLRHPLLVPLVDYGRAAGCWFEARACAPPIGGTRSQIRRTAMHLERFLVSNDVNARGDCARESLRAAVERPCRPWRPIGHRLRGQWAMEALLAVLQEDGRPGTTCVTVCGSVSSGLRTLALEIARAARLAGFVAVDARITGSFRTLGGGRHYCVLDWLPEREQLPALLAGAAADGRAHAWFRFVRTSHQAGVIVRLERFTKAELMDMVYQDVELGPSTAEREDAAHAAAGLPGRFIDILARVSRDHEPLRVHETAPAYVCDERQSSTGTPSDGSAEELLLARGGAALERLQFREAEAACRTVLAGGPSPPLAEAARVLLARSLAGAGDADGAAAVLTEPLISHNARAAADAASLARAAGDLARAAALARRALELAAAEEHATRARAHLVLADVARSTSDAVATAANVREAALHARRARRFDLLLLAKATVCEPARAERLVTRAARISSLCERDVRERLNRRYQPAPAAHDHIGALENLLGIVFGAPDDRDALQQVAGFLRTELSACTVAIHGAEGRPLATAGRPWPDVAPIADVVVCGGASVARDAVMPYLGEPIRTGGITIGCIAARWLPDTAPMEAAAGLLRVAAAAIATAVASLNAPPPSTASLPAPDALLGRGPAADRVRELIRCAAAAPYPVLIQGESGSGKELVARAIHARSTRRSRRFCAVNCAAFTDDLLEAELFGHARGAFTGAIAERAGLFEDADQGTLFLDEVAELSPRAQAKLLRVLQDGEVRRVGETAARRVDVRVLAATNRSLCAEVDGGRFRADLRFRLDVLRIEVPPLRERPDEVSGLAQRLWSEAAVRVGTRAVLAPDFLAALARYDWPGNVRELQNVLAAVAVHAPRRGLVHAASLPPHVARMAGKAGLSFEAARLEFEQRFVRAALARAGGRRTIAARQLGVTRQGFAKMVKRLGLEALAEG